MRSLLSRNHEPPAAVAVLEAQPLLPRYNFPWAAIVGAAERITEAEAGSESGAGWRVYWLGSEEDRGGLLRLDCWPEDLRTLGS